MSKEVLKWLAALGTGAIWAVLSYLQAHSNTTPGVHDPLISGVLVAALTKIVAWLTSKAPVQPTA